MNNLSFYKGKKILITGHTGFKGAWLTMLLKYLGADVVGYALKPEDLSLYNLCNIDNKIKSYIGDIRDYDYLKEIIEKEKPEIVFHLAAVAIVNEGYLNPKNTYETNIMGTINILECIRNSNYVKSFINVTTDKVYKEKDSILFEDDELNGYDPYSNSKSCSELISQTYIRSFFKDKDIGISTLRSGNVIGGGDFGKHRLIPDCFRSIINNETLIIRNPKHKRSYQHVLDSLYAYLLIAYKQYEDHKYASSYNIGPDTDTILSNIELIDLLKEELKKYNIELNYKFENNLNIHETKDLIIDNNKLKKAFDLKAKLSINDTINEISSFINAYINNEDIESYIKNIIDNYFKKY